MNSTSPILEKGGAFKCSSESREGLAVCRQGQMLSPSYFKTLSITLAALQSSALPC